MDSLINVIEALEPALMAILGSALSIVGLTIQRRWSRSDQRRNERRSAIQELTTVVADLPVWANRWTKSAFDGEILPLPDNLMRLQILVDGYFPELDSSMTEMSIALGKFNATATDFAVFVAKNPKQPPSVQQMDDFKKMAQELIQAAGKVGQTISKIIASDRI
jgi:hypothetical protein